MIKKYLNQNIDFRYSRLLLLFTFFLCNSFIEAQQSEDYINKNTPTVYLVNGTSLYSTDETFNNSVNIVVLENHKIISPDNSSIHSLHSSPSIQDESKKDLSLQLKYVNDKKLNKELKKVKEEIANHEKRKESFKKFILDCFPSDEQFFSVNSASKNYIAPSHNGSGSFKISVLNKDYSIKKALNYLHTTQYTYYNNKSLDYCFSQVYSVRPPPVLV